MASSACLPHIVEFNSSPALQINVRASSWLKLASNVTWRKDRWPPQKSFVAAWSARCQSGSFRGAGGAGERESIEREP